jgi:hypothetical protein
MDETLKIHKPESYTQKIQLLKLLNTDPYYSILVDKYQVRTIVEKILGERYLIPLLGVWDNFEQIEFDRLPDRFVLKTTHDSGNVLICKSKATFDVGNARHRLDNALKLNYFYKSREYPYKNAIPRIIAEKYLSDNEQSELDDYKFFCFDGVVKFIEITKSKGNFKARGYFDINFKPLPFFDGNATKLDLPAPPLNSAEMIRIAETLSKGLLHVRIDLYNIHSQIYFGEFTFHHNGGIIHFHPTEWNKKIGDMINLPSTLKLG